MLGQCQHGELSDLPLFMRWKTIAAVLADPIGSTAFASANSEIGVVP